MDNIVVNGLQYGDEGKGKIIDFISLFYDLNIRNNGGHNAGHIIYYNENKVKIKILPSSILKNCLCLLSDEVIISLYNLIRELYYINLIKKKTILISRNCLINFKIDELLDCLIDKLNNIGTTKNGIIISFIRKIIKCCIRMEDVFKFIYLYKFKKEIFFYNIFFFFFNFKFKIFFLKKFFITLFYHLKIKKNIINNLSFTNCFYKKIFENSQGINLDINFGTYPFVTNSVTLSKSIFINSKFYFSNIKYIGIFKIYLTRVGNGYFITSFKKKKRDFFSLINNEIGTNTKRLRNTGFLDLVSIYNNIKLNNISNIILTKLDSIICLKFFKILINYKIKKKKKYITNNNYNIYIPIYKKFKTWKFVRSQYKKNPIEFHNCLRFLEKFLFTPINIISIGKLTNDLIFL